jgi:hypothetical protein
MLFKDDVLTGKQISKKGGMWTDIKSGLLTIYQIFELGISLIVQSIIDKCSS